MSVTTPWFGTVAVDESGDHLINGVIWMDSRGVDDVREILIGPFKIGGYPLFKAFIWQKLTGGLPTLTGIDRSKLPDLISAMDIVGPVKKEIAAELGLKEGTPVIGGTPDVPSAGVGSGAVRDYEGHLYVGTSSWIAAHVRSGETMH